MALAQFTNKLTTTPVDIQDGFGSSGQELPLDGLEYCCPTAVAMSISYLGVNGFNQLAPADPTTASGLNLDDILSGLMLTSPVGGTATVSDMTSAIFTYLAAKGIGSSSYSLGVTGDPTVSQLQTLNQPGTVVDLVGGYYTSSGVREGGHCVALDSENVNIEGQTVNGLLGINNPLPSAWTEYPDLSANSVEDQVTQATTGVYTSHGSIELSPSQFPSLWSEDTLVIETAISLTVNPGQQSVNDPTPAAWNLSGTQTIPLNGGDLSVLAPIQGGGGIDLDSAGTLDFQSADTSTGSNAVVAGTLRSEVSSGTPLGSGSLSIQGGTLQLAPSAGNAATLAIAGGAGSDFVYADGAVLMLDPNGSNPLSLTLGGNTDGATSNLVASGPAVLMIVPGTGDASLGSQIQVTCAGNAGNLPQNTNGIVSPGIVSEDSDGELSGDFLTYGAAGFTVANYTSASSEPIALAGATANYYDNLAQSLPAGTTATVNSLKVGPVVLSGGTASVLNVASGGVILNGGTISTTDLNFGAAQGYIYSSLAGGTIASIIQGSGAVSTFGPGTTTFSGANTYSGGTYIQSGTLLAARSSGSATGGGLVSVEPNAAFQVAGTAGGGTTTVASGGTLDMAGGTLSGPLVLNAGSYLQGSGKITGTATIDGTIDSGAAPDNLTFTGTVTANTPAIYLWRLNALDANPADAGITWSHLTFDGSSDEIGNSSSNYISLSLDLAPGLPTPDSGNLFWDSAHTWNVASASPYFYYIYYFYDFASFVQGYFSVSANSPTYSNLYVDYTPYTAGSANFIAAGTASWAFSGNWTNERVAENVGDTADFTAASSATTVTLDGDWTAGHLIFSDANSYTITPGTQGTLTLDSGATSASIAVLNGTHSIMAPMVLNSSALVTMASGTALTLSGPIGGAGALTVAGSGSVTLSGSNSYSGGTTIDGGTCLVNSANSLPNGGNVSVGAAAVLRLAANIAAPTLGALVIAGGTFDVNGATVLLEYQNLDPIASIASYLQSGYAGGAWNGSGIVSSAVAALNAGQRQLVYAVGYADGADGLIPGLSSGQIEIMPTLAGDAKLQGNVVFGDFQILAEYFGHTGGWDEGNFTYGATIDFGDFQLLAQDFGNSPGMTAGQMASLNNFAAQFGAMLSPNGDGDGFSVVSVPEPAAVGLIGLSSVVALARRRRKSQAPHGT